MRAALLLALCSCRSILGIEEPVEGEGPQVSCTGDLDCPASNPVCDLATEVCVECTAANASRCSGTTPVCDTTTHSCDACAKHEDCIASEVCAPDGSCLLEADVAYAAANGTGTVCTRNQPCPSIGTALARSRPNVKVAAGSYAGISISQSVRIFAVKGATISSVTANSGTIEIRGGSISNPTGTGVLLTSSSAANLSLFDIDIRNCKQGLSQAAGKLLLSRCTIRDNTEGGILVNGATTLATIRHNFIHNNGTTSSIIGGAELTAGNGSSFEFNTVAFNTSMANGNSGGVACTGSTIPAGRNIIFGNRDGTMLTDGVQANGDCAFGNSLMKAADPQYLGFKSIAAPFDLHLTATSPPSVLDAAGNCNERDADDEQRPFGGACDLGADELVP